MMNNPSRKKLHPAELNLQDFWALFTVSTKRPPRPPSPSPSHPSSVSSCSHGLPLPARRPAALMFFSDRCVLEARLWCCCGAGVCLTAM